MDKTIVFIIKLSKDNIEAFTTKYQTIDDVKKNITIYDQFNICVLLDNTDVVYLNLSSMFCELKYVIDATTWEDLESKLTELDCAVYQIKTLVPRYMKDIVNNQIENVPTPYVSNLKNWKTPDVISIEHNNKIEVGYGDIENPFIRNINNLKWMAKDIIFSQETNDEILNFENTIPSINGYIAYPNFFKGELYARHCVEYVKSTHGRNKNLVLIDFSPCGKIECIRISDCKRKDYSQTEVGFKLPEKYTTKGKLPMLVIAGRLYFPSEVTTVSDSIISFDFEYSNLFETLATNKLIKCEQVVNTDTVVLPTLREYIDTLFESDNYDAFIILLNNTTFKKNIIRKTSKISRKDLLFPPDAHGLLRRVPTREITDYVRVPKTRFTRLLIDFPYDVKLPRNEYDGNPNLKIGFELTNNRCYEYKDLLDNNFELIQMLSE